MGLDDQGSEAQFPTEIHFTSSTPVLGPIQPFTQWVLGGSYCTDKAMKESLLNRYITVQLLKSVPHALISRNKTRSCYWSICEGCSNETDLHVRHPHKSAYGLKIQVGQRHEGHGRAVVPAAAQGVLCMGIYCLVHQWDACPMGNIFNGLYSFI
jgi:hypothetical protein